MVHKKLKVNTACICKERSLFSQQRLVADFLFSSAEQERAAAARAEAQRLEAIRAQEEQKRAEQERLHQEKLRQMERQMEIDKAKFQAEQERIRRQKIQVLVELLLWDVTQLLSLPSVKETARWPQGKSRLMGVAQGRDPQVRLLDVNPKYHFLLNVYLCKLPLLSIL